MDLHSTTLCNICRKIDFKRGLQGNWNEEIPLGTLAAILQKRQHCRFCNLICEALKQVNGGALSPELAHDGKPITCDLWNTQGGRSQCINGVTSTERLLRVRLYSHWKKEFDGLNITARQLATDRRESNLFLGRYVSDGQISFETVKQWLRSCECWHGINDNYRGCGRRTWEATLGKPESLRVIDVHRKCIVQVPEDCRYVALSYVWGGAITLEAKVSNIEFLSQPGGLLSAFKTTPIAQTILDAIELTQNIEEDYLWVDSLCIVQDDQIEKHRQISAMDQVYGSAVLTIVAAGGNSASSGLAGVRPSSRAINQITAEVSPGVSIAVPLSLHGFQLNSSKWNTRAWTYQERLLSKRFLIFTPQGVYWQCRTMIRMEDVFLESEGVYDSEMMSFADRLRFLDVDAQWSGDEGEGIPITKNQIRFMRSPTLTQYMWALEEYTQRELSFPQDILNAFAGIQRILELGLHSLWYGLPLNYLDLALLWRPGQLSTRRVDSSGQAGLQIDIPSWSWAGWVGPVHYWTLFPDHGRHTDEERVRPLLRWYRWDAKNGISRVSQHWESASSTHQYVEPEAWLPLDLPPDFFAILPKVSDASWRKDRLYFRTYSATFVLGVYHEKSNQRFGSTFDIENAVQVWIGLAEMNVNIKSGSACEFLIISEAQWVGIHSLDQTYRYEHDHYLYFNVLAITWNEEVASRIGIGRIKKEAWANADPVCKDIVLG